MILCCIKCAGFYTTERNEAFGGKACYCPRGIEFVHTAQEMDALRVQLTATQTVSDQHVAASAELARQAVRAQAEASRWQSEEAQRTRERDEARALFTRHTEAVAEFLNELYAIMVDPLGDEPYMEVAQAKAALLAAAKRDRELKAVVDLVGSQIEVGADDCIRECQRADKAELALTEERAKRGEADSVRGAFAWLEERIMSERGALVLCLCEDGDIGIFVDPLTEQSKSIGKGESLSECLHHAKTTNTK